MKDTSNWWAVTYAAIITVPASLGDGWMSRFAGGTEATGWAFLTSKASTKVRLRLSRSIASHLEAPEPRGAAIRRAGSTSACPALRQDLALAR
jgi:hypothetical protein